MVVNLNINKNFSKLFYIITIFQIFNFIKAETTEDLIDKTQMINNIIYIGNISYRYMNFASYSNGDMVVETTCYPENIGRMFYGLKSNGRPFFKNKSNNKETPYYSINVEDAGENYKSLEGDGIIIKLSSNENNGKEYFLSISKMACNAELFDFDNDKVYTKTVNSFTTFSYINSLRNALIPLSSTNTEYYYIFGFSGFNYQQKYWLQKHIFNSLNNFMDEITYTGQSVGSEYIPYGSQISCFLTIKKLINCFYMTWYFDSNINGFFYINNIVKYENDFSNKKEFVFPSNSNNTNSFLKCIHLKGEIGVYAYYLYKDNLFYPVFLFKEFDSNSSSFIDYLPSYEISNPRFLNNLLINDLII